MQITQTLRKAVQTAADRPLTVFADRTRTASEVLERVRRAAGVLEGLGVAEGDRVGILALNSDRYFELLFAAPWAGAVVNPVNTRWSVEEIAYSLVDCDTRVLFVDDAFARMIRPLRDRVPHLGTVVFIGDGSCPDGASSYEALLADARPLDDAGRGGDDLFGVFYTGGTSGAPKGVMLTHDNVLVAALGSVATTDLIAPRGRLLHSAPMFHLADLASWAMGMLLGSTHVMVPAFTPAGVARAIEEHRVTDTLLVPTMIQMLVDSPDTRDADLSSLTRVLYGASSISQAVLDRAARALPNARFTQAYGMTELAPVATLLTAEDHRAPALSGSCGRPISTLEVRIVDANDAEVPRGTVGEIVARGDQVMVGYWNQPELTAAALAGGWMHTGDAGYMTDDGYVFVVDRIKDMIVTGGENVYSAEVENALAQHPAVASCAVIGVPDEEWGERVHAVVVLQPGVESLQDVELREFCRERIANYKLPRSIDFVAALPVSGAGKILKRELRAAING